MKRWYSIQAAAQGSDTAEVEILDVIHPYYGLSAQNFRADFKAATAEAKKVRVSINSPGGLTTEGFAIFNTLRASGKEIETRVLGIAGSMASVIFMAGSKRVMPDNTLLFTHNAGLAPGWSDAEDLREIAADLDKIDQQIVATYVAASGRTEDEIRALMREDRLLTAAEALELGLATEVVETVAATAQFDLDDMPEAVRKVFEAAKSSSAPAAPDPTFADVIRREVEAAGLAEFAATWALDPNLRTPEALRAAVAEAREIKDIAEYVGRADDAAALIRGRKSLAEARQALAAAAAADAPHINSSPKEPAGRAGADISATGLWSQIRELEQKK